MRTIGRACVKLLGAVSLATLLVSAGCTFDSSLQGVRCSEDGERSEGRVCQDGHWIVEADAELDTRPPSDIADTAPEDVAADTDTTECAPNQAMCADTCVDTLTSEDHCGACGQACNTYGSHSLALCTQGACERTCEQGWRDDDGDWIQADDPSVSNGCEVACEQIAEICDGIDNDCDGDVDEDVLITYYLDADDDGYGVDGEVIEACAADGEYRATEGGDCDDGAFSINPDATESCNGVDENCNSDIDEGCPCDEMETANCYTGAAGTAGVGLCAQGTKTCDGAGSWGSCQGEVTPQTEVCDDGQDNDCDGDADCSDADCEAQSCGGGSDICHSGSCCTPQSDSAFCTNQSAQCGRVSGVDNCGIQRTDYDCGSCGGGTSCTSNTCHESSCGDGNDNDADGDIDCFDSDCAASPTTYYFDDDGDDFGLSSDSTQACAPNSNYTATDSGDCDDTDDKTFPGAAESDSLTDCMRDDDQDGWGDVNAPSGGVAGSDCDDTDADIHPTAPEECADDAIDSDCDGVDDKDDPSADDWCTNNQSQTTGCGLSGSTTCCLNNGGSCS